LDITAARVIAIDGDLGAGKSVLAEELSRILKFPCVHLDDFVMPDRGGFVEFIRYSELQTALSGRSVVVEGICLMAVLKRLRVAPDVLVYVQGPAFDPRPLQIDVLTTEVLNYNREFEPMKMASIVYMRPTDFLGGSMMEASNTEIDLLLIKAQTRTALALAGGGLAALCVGLALLLYGITGQDKTLIKAGTVEISGSGLGSVIMVTSILWAFFSYKSRPTYTRIRETSEKYDANRQLRERVFHETATRAVVVPRRRGGGDQC
jgi:hypothetical protein